MFHHAVLLAFLCCGVSAPSGDVLASAGSASFADAVVSAETGIMPVSVNVLTSASSAPSADVLTSAPSADAVVSAETELVSAEPRMMRVSVNVLTSASSASSADVLTSASSASSADAFAAAKLEFVSAAPGTMPVPVFVEILTSASSASSADVLTSASSADALTSASSADALASADGRLTGRITDTSAAALPGVTVTITAETLSPPVVLITDEVGRYTSPLLPEGRYTITFELGGFSPERREAVDVRAGEVVVLDRQLVVGTVTENVEVVATAPPPPAPFPKFEATPAPKITPIPREALASVCGPGQPDAEDMSVGKILGHRDESSRMVFGARDILLLDIGADFGAAVGQNYVVRRRFRLGDKTAPTKDAAFGEQTAALVQVVEANPATSVAVVVYACGELFAGDSIEPFDPLPLLSAHGGGAPQFDDPARIILGEHGFSMGAPKQLMVIDRGTAHGAVRGQRLTIFRRMQGENGPVSRIADAVVIAVREHSATIRIERASDAVSVGDLAALHH